MEYPSYVWERVKISRRFVGLILTHMGSPRPPSQAYSHGNVRSRRRARGTAAGARRWGDRIGKDIGWSRGWICAEFFGHFGAKWWVVWTWDILPNFLAILSKQWIEVSDVTYPFVNLKYWRRNLHGSNTACMFRQEHHGGPQPYLPPSSRAMTGHILLEHLVTIMQRFPWIGHKTHWSVIRTMHHAFFCKHEADVPLICSPDAQYIQFWWNQHVPFSLIDISLFPCWIIIFDGWTHVKSHLRCLFGFDPRWTHHFLGPFSDSLARSKPSRCTDPDNQPAALEESRPCNGPEAHGPVMPGAIVGIGDMGMMGMV